MTDDHTFFRWLALHTQNLLADSRASLLIAESSDSALDPHTLARFSVQGTANHIKSGSALFLDQRSSYLDKYPQAERNFELGDFLLYTILPSSARYVAGFNRIYDLSLKDFNSAPRTMR